MIHNHIRGLAVFAECLAVGLACSDQRRLTGSGSVLEALCDNALYKYTYFTLLTYFTERDNNDHMVLAVTSLVGHQVTHRI